MSNADDLAWLRDVVVDVLRSPTQVPPGQTEIAPGDEAIRRSIDQVVLPRVEELQPDEIRIHPWGDVAARFGPPGDSGLLLQTYIVSQHANLMSSDLAGHIPQEPGDELIDRRVIGQGASQVKGAMASALAAIRVRPNTLEHPVWLTVNTEGKSSHSGSKRILDDLGVTAAQGILVVGTDLNVSLGNRGRVDVRITLSGESSHSSQPWLGHNPIEDASDVIVALRTLRLPEAHDILGPATATPFQLSCEPIAPHTIPQTSRIKVDRRLLPGETPESAVDGIREHLQEALPDIAASVEVGEVMLPAVVARDEAVVVALLDGLQRESGRAEEAIWSLNTFDAGYPCDKGIPTVMFGPGKRHFAGPGLLAEDTVSFRDLWKGVEVLRHAMTRLCS